MKNYSFFQILLSMVAYIQNLVADHINDHINDHISVDLIWYIHSLYDIVISKASFTPLV